MVYQTPRTNVSRFLLWLDSPYCATVSFVSKLHYHTQEHHTREDSSARVIGPSQRPLTENKQHSQETNIHAPGGIRTRNSNKRASADPRLRPRGHWDRKRVYFRVI